MAYSLQKSMVAKVVGIALVMTLAACSSDQRYKRQVSGDESYLDAAPLKQLNAPSGLILPVQTGDYNVPVSAQKGQTGKQLDIRPPVQPLALLSGSRGQNTSDSGTLLFENSPKNQNLWPRVASLIQAKNMPIASRQDADQTLTTDWVKWSRLDEDDQYEGRYQITVEQQGYQQALVVKTLELRQQGKTDKVTNPVEVQRYNSMMINTIVEGLDKQENLTSSQTAKRTETLDVQNGTNDAGLPMLIVRAPFPVVWERLPATLEKLGMKVRDRSRSKGSVSVTYKSPSAKDWGAMGVKAPGLKDGDYKLQLGDLNNRVSLQLLDSKGKPLSQAQNDALMPVFQAAFSQTSVK
ncbi:outer membrane protein assembly factor BamC [Serratia sp. UGAL515B_01]|uniref:outer membrane protein assembly factor BamC n=1 Tax=Serratia sp. UGAL515B_01 TaxID=2986763 RepID=UPI0029529FE6|nr:outer membrane protein assembly factor BamC [Serratia sp. UGAL515B_01]WON75796.1 outer membrane protein assembly factor BamC [Serratia sp. UGAL515B_01]